MDGAVSAQASALTEAPHGPEEVRAEPTFGMKARVPVSGESVGGTRLVSHKVRAVIRGGFARTTVEEVWANDTSRVLEGVLSFSLPSRAAVSRLALEVDGRIVEGEIEERRRAKQIFRSLTDFVPTPKDPALLEIAGARGELRIYPMPPHGTRRVFVAYDEVLSEVRGEGRYVLPLTLGEGQGTRVGELDVEVRVDGGANVRAAGGGDVEGEIVRQKATDVTPAQDLVVRYDAPSARVTRQTPEPGSFGEPSGRAPTPFVGLRFTVPAAATIDPPATLVVAVERAHGAPSRAMRLAEAVLRAAPRSRFVLLACDAACESFPEVGAADPGDLARAMAWLEAHPAAGAFDLAGAGKAAVARAGAGGHAIVLSRGAASAGELASEGIAARIRGDAPADVELRLVAVGAEADLPLLTSVAGKLSATLVEDRGEPAGELGARLLAPALHAARLELPDGLTQVEPKDLPSLLAGDELIVTARADAAPRGVARLTGELDRAAVAVSVPLDGELVEASLLATTWARARIASLEAAGSALAVPEIVRLSRAFHVPSRATSLIVLENEAMFRAFGVARTHRRIDDFGAPTGAVGAPLGAPEVPSAPMGARSGPGLGVTGAAGVTESPRAVDGGGVGVGLGRLSGEHAVKAPTVRQGATSVSGRLAPEIVRRVVRQSYGRLRQCYLHVLQASPGAEGRVTVRFLIGSDGAVSAVQVTENTTGVASLGACVAAAFRSMSFPSPDGGSVTVTYPFVFNAGDGGIPQPPARFAPSSNAQPTVTAGSDTWRFERGGELARLEKRRDEQPLSRSAREALVTGLVRRGQLARALEAAAGWTVMDRDEPASFERLAEVAALAGDAQRALRALSDAVAVSPRSIGLQRRAARGHSLAGDRVRACAFARAAASLSDSTLEDKVEALRCRASLGDPGAAAEAAEFVAKSPIARELAAGRPAPAADGPPGALSFELACAANCPAFGVVTPEGRAVTVVTPTRARATSSRLDLPSTNSGTYRVVWLGAPPSEELTITVRGALGERKIGTRPGVTTLCSVDVPSVSLSTGWGRAQLR